MPTGLWQNLWHNWNCIHKLLCKTFESFHFVLWVCVVCHIGCARKRSRAIYTQPWVRWEGYAPYINVLQCIWLPFDTFAFKDITWRPNWWNKYSFVLPIVSWWILLQIHTISEVYIVSDIWMYLYKYLYESLHGLRLIGNIQDCFYGLCEYNSRGLLKNIIYQVKIGT